MFEKKSIVDYLKQYNLFTDSEINEFISLATISTIIEFLQNTVNLIRAELFLFHNI